MEAIPKTTVLTSFAPLSDLPGDKTPEINVTRFIAFVWTLLLTLFGNLLSAQNLVQNSGFDIYTTCPGAQSTISDAPGWDSLRPSPDFFHSCAPVYVYGQGIPYNLHGYQPGGSLNPSGNGYAGMLCYGSFNSTLSTNAREYIKGTLTQPLTIGTKYFVKLRFSLANLSAFAVNKLGVKFLVSAPWGYPITNSAHVFTTTIITDTMNWVTVSGSFIADSSYTSFGIGNHFDDSNTSFTQVQPVGWHGHNAYYLVDEVCVSDDSRTCNPFISVEELQFQMRDMLLPNPFSQTLFVELASYEDADLTLFYLNGTIASRQHLVGPTRVDTEPLAQGIYIYEIKRSDGLIKRGKVSKN